MFVQHNLKQVCKLHGYFIMDVLNSPQGYFDWVHQEMRKAYLHRKHPWRFVCFSTIGAEGPESRMVVLRKYTVESHFHIFTDSRSKKVAQIMQNRSAHLLFWHDPKKLQVRIKATVELHHQNELTRETWSALHPGQREEYLKEQPPGKQIDEPGAFHEKTDATNSSRFVVLEVKPQAWDLLHLHSDGHRRVEVLKATDGWQAEWVMP